jgi:hypothetical protein
LRNSFWAYDRAAQATSPVPGWRPGHGGGRERARLFIQWYLSSLVGYERFIIQQEQRAFPGTAVEVLFPAGGLRPGQVDEAVVGGLGGNSVAERNGSLQQGLDWANQVHALPAGTIVYSTNVAAPSLGASTVLEAPIYYLAQLAAARGLAVAGENAGDEGASALTLSVDRARTLLLTQLFWFSEADFFSGRADRPGASDARQAARVLAGSGPS